MARKTSTTTNRRRRIAQVDPVTEPRPDGRAEEDADRGRARDVRVDATADEVDDRAGRRGDADHHVARRGRDAERDAHRQVHQRHLDDPAADPEQGRQHSGAGRPDHPEPEVADAVARAGQPLEGRGGLRRRGIVLGIGSGSAVSVAVSGGVDRRPARAIVAATYRSRPPNSSDSSCSSSRNAIEPPTSAPVAVNSSRVIPSRRFATCRSR